MSKQKKTLFSIPLIFSFLIIFSIISSPVFADAGMWMPHQMKDLNLEARGLKMDPNNLYKKDGTGLMSAVVGLGGGTGEFVSSNGLILTNHHVAFGAIQRASDKDHDYITHGFLAKNVQEEIQAIGNYADVLIGYEDVTAKVQKALKPGLTPLKTYKALDRIKKRLIAKAERGGKDLYCTLKSMYSGNKYYLFTFKRLRDIRIVYAPPRSIGNYGGDIDNWMWPRHTNDFTYLRAYVSKDNIGTEYSPDNVPYQPKSYLKLSIDGVKEGDFTFIMGYPGRTYRNYTLAEMMEDLDEIKERIVLYKEFIDFFEEAGKGDRATQITYASRIKGLNNGLKNRTGKLEGFKKFGIIQKKRDFEREFTQWVEAAPERKKSYGTALKDIEVFLKRYKPFKRKFDLMDSFTQRYRGPALMAQANLIYRTVTESQKPDMKRDSGYQKRDLPMTRTKIKIAQKGYTPEVDKTFATLLLKKLFKMPKDSYPDVFKPIFAKGEAAIDAYVESLYKGTLLNDPKKRLEMLRMKPAKLLKLKDPIIALVAELDKEMKIMREKKKAFTQEREDLKKVYQAGLLAMKEGKISPDANSSIRFTCGNVEGYEPRDGVHFKPHTTLKGVIEKESGKYPFLVPEKLKALYKDRDFGKYEDKELKNIVTCFLNSTNVTGGNSGSPVLNAKGEQVGIVFDMTYESVTGDYYVVSHLQRVINVDIRYVLFVTEKFAGATHLIKEIGL